MFGRSRFYIETDDLRQAAIVAENEVMKFVKGKRFLVYVLLMAAIFVLVTFLPYAFGSTPGDTKAAIVGSYLTFADGLALIAATLFASTVLVSEFEERTALVLFTRPVKRTTVFLGKFLACYVLEAVMIILYYGLMCLVSFVLVGGVASRVGTSLGIALLYLLAASAVAMFISGMAKKSSVSTVITFLVLLLVIPIISMVLSGAGDIDTWFMLNTDDILYCVPDYVDQINKVYEDIGDSTGIDMSGSMAEVIDAGRAAVVDVVWALVFGLIGWYVFVRREF